MDASRSAIFDKSNALPPNTASNWKPIGTILETKNSANIFVAINEIIIYKNLYVSNVSCKTCMYLMCQCVAIILYLKKKVAHVETDPHIMPIAVIANTIIGSIWLRRCLARPANEYFQTQFNYSYFHSPNGIYCWSCDVNPFTTHLQRQTSNRFGWHEWIARLVILSRYVLTIQNGWYRLVHFQYLLYYYWAIVYASLDFCNYCINLE